MLDKAPEPLSQRVANHIYEACRSEQIKVVGFPNFASAVSAIQNMRPTDTGKEYQVTVKKHDKLVILKALAAKWMGSEFKDATTAEIEKHNNEFNQDGEYWHEANERTALLNNSKAQLFFHFPKRQDFSESEDPSTLQSWTEFYMCSSPQIVFFPVSNTASVRAHPSGQSQTMKVVLSSGSSWKSRNWPRKPMLSPYKNRILDCSQEHQGAKVQWLIYMVLVKT